MMKERLQNIKDEALKAIEAADMPEKLNDVRVKFLGKKGVRAAPFLWKFEIPSKNLLERFRDCS